MRVRALPGTFSPPLLFMLVHTLFVHNLGGRCRCAGRSISLDRHNTKQALCSSQFTKVAFLPYVLFSLCYTQ